MTGTHQDAPRRDPERPWAEGFEADGPKGLPIDSDVEVDDVPPGSGPRPVRLRPQHLGVVFLGGALGTGAREALSLLIPAAGGFPLAIFVINVTGALALGAALEILLRLGPDEGRRRRLRLFVGTGLIGGYTTYSTLAVGVAQALAVGDAVLGILYGLLSVVAGAAAGFAGIALGTEAHRRRTAPARQRRQRR
ncbi:MAG: CrcB family protein [Microbacteriaceae bacterium]